MPRASSAPAVSRPTQRLGVAGIQILTSLVCVLLHGVADGTGPSEVAAQHRHDLRANASDLAADALEYKGDISTQHAERLPGQIRSVGHIAQHDLRLVRPALDGGIAVELLRIHSPAAMQLLGEFVKHFSRALGAAGEGMALVPVTIWSKLLRSLVWLRLRPQ